MADTREKGLQDYRKKLLEHKEIDGRLKECKLEFKTVTGGCCKKLYPEFRFCHFN